MTEEIKKDKKINEIEKIKKDLEDLKVKSDEYLNNWKRERADFINYKKDEMERIGFLGKYVKEDIILKILPILDNIYLAEKQLPENLKNGSTGSPQAIEWTKGFLQIQSQILDFFKKEGIEGIEIMGKAFDLNTMEAVGEAEGGDAGTIVEEVQKGYTMDGKVIRPAKVRVTK